MNTIVFGNYTLQQILIVAGIVVGVVIFLKIIKKLFSSDKVDQHHQIVKCRSCGWKGQVSRHAGICPKCNKPLGEQKAKAYRK